MRRSGSSAAFLRGMLLAILLAGTVASASCGSSPTNSPTSTSPGTGAGTSGSTTVPTTASSTTETTPPPSVELALHDGSEVSCSLTSNGATCPVHGTAQVNSGNRVLLWVEPVQPQAPTFPEYYLQGGINGGVTQQPKAGGPSTWKGAIQLGNAQYPPCAGDVLNMIATVADAGAAATFEGSQQQTYRDPAGAKQALASSEAQGVTVGGVPACHH